MGTCKCGQVTGPSVGAGTTGPAPAALHLGIATIPFQPWETVYPPQKALCRGTVFPSLDLPFYGGGEGHV